MFHSCKEKTMPRYVFDTQQITQILDKTIDLFLEYQFKHGYDEPKARSEAIREIIGLLRSVKGDKPPGV